ncbi:hypothetical protein KC325_g270 [Hortaea werneckii]|nr:hypothetical protein KC325_g270 [Hortaea werneckii]
MTIDASAAGSQSHDFAQELVFFYAENNRKALRLFLHKPAEVDRRSPTERTRCAMTGAGSGGHNRRAIGWVLQTRIRMALRCLKLT